MGIRYKVQPPTNAATIKKRPMINVSKTGKFIPFERLSYLVDQLVLNIVAMPVHS